MIDWVTPFNQETFGDGFMVGYRLARSKGMTVEQQQRLIDFDIRTAGSWHSGRTFGFLLGLAQSRQIPIREQRQP